MNMRKAVITSIMWVVLALLFNVGIYYQLGSQKALEFLTGYLIELSLSVDNIFVFLLIFSYFKTGPDEQKKILFWGVLGAQLMRLIFIFAGIAVLNKFQWVIYIFGSLLVFTGIKLFFDKGKEKNPADNPVIKLVKKAFPRLSQFWLILIVIEMTDLLFAVDSVPAVLAVTKDPFIVYTSNVFAILGLRAMYFALLNVMPMFHYLHYALGAVLVFVGLKMLLEHFVHIPTGVALGFIVLALGSAVLASIMSSKKQKPV